MGSLRKICEVKLCEGVRNTATGKMYGLKEDVLTKLEKDKSRWFGYLDWMSEGRMAKDMYGANVECNARRGRK